jgi:F-type H+-transporting ATPase subunit delta
MNQSKIHVRYAKALFQLALEKGVLDEVKADIDLLYKIFSEHDDFIGLSSNPVIKGEAKRKIYHALFSKHIHTLTFSFIELLLENKREEFIPDIARRFIFLYKKEKNILSVTLTSSEKLGKDSVDMILARLKVLFRCEVEFDLKTDETLIGGFQLRIDDMLLDASVKGELKKIRSDLIDKTSKQII